MTGNFDRDIETEIFSWNEWNVVPFLSLWFILFFIYRNVKIFVETNLTSPVSSSLIYLFRLKANSLSVDYRDKRSSYFFTMTTLETSNVKSRHIDPRRAASLLTLWLSFPCAPLSFSCAPTPTRNRLWKYTNSCTEGKKSWIELSVPEATSL